MKRPQITQMKQIITALTWIYSDNADSVTQPSSVKSKINLQNASTTRSQKSV